MANITVRNIPEEIIRKIRILSSKERRSLNNQILMVLEAGLEKRMENDSKTQIRVDKEAQLNIWDKLCGRWNDERTSAEIVDDIMEHRTEGRKVQI